MNKTDVKVSLTKHNRLSIYTADNFGLFANQYTAAFEKSPDGLFWSIVLTPSVKGGSVFAEDKSGLRIQFARITTPTPNQFNVCDAIAFHAEDGRITIHLPEVLPRYKERARYSTGKADPSRVLARAVRDINRCVNDMEGLRLRISESGRLVATITIEQTFDGEE